MENPKQIKELAGERLAEAKILADNEKYNGAFYLLGYSIELMLKAKICEHLVIPNLFDNACSIDKRVKDVVRTHDITTLLILSGLKSKFDGAKSDNPTLMKTNALLFENSGKSGKCNWNEQKRYQSGSQTSVNVQELIELLNHEEGLLKWIEKS